MSERKKAIFITGAASGMGLETARLFAKEGWFVGAYDVNVDGLDALRAEIGDENCIAEPLDVTDRSAYEAVMGRFAEKTDGKLDILFNNAGIGGFTLFADMSFEYIDRVIDINLRGVINGIHFGLPLLKNTENALCFSTSSSSGIFGVPGISIYSATKHAVKGLTESLSVELAAFGIRVADTLPGVIDTPIMAEADLSEFPKTGPWRPMPATSVAECAWKAYHSNDLHYYVPEELQSVENEALDGNSLRDRWMTGSVWTAEEEG